MRSVRSLSAWTDSLFDSLEAVLLPQENVNYVHVNSSPDSFVDGGIAKFTTTAGVGVNSHFNHTATISGCSGCASAGTSAWYPEVEINPWITWPSYYPIYQTHIYKFIEKEGTPWDNLPNFPPVDVELNGKTKSIRFRWALAGFKKDLIDVEFEDEKLILTFKEAEKKAEEETSEWATIRKGIKGVTGKEYKYDLPAKFDVTAAKALWEDGILTVEVPLREDKKPVKLQIN